jgi:hypothetical protein
MTDSPNTSEFFDARRFWLLCTSHWQAQRRHHLSWLAVATALAVLVLFAFLSGMYSDHPTLLLTRVQSRLYYSGFLLFGVALAAQHFGPMRRPEQALLVLMRPATVTEKWGLAALTSLLLFPLVYTLWFSLLVWPASRLSLAWDSAWHLRNPLQGDAMPEDYRLFLPWRGGEGGISVRTSMAWFLFYFGLAGLATTGSLLFRRAPVLSTLLLAFGVFLGSILLFVPHLRDHGWDLIMHWWRDDGARMPLGIHLVNACFWLGIPSLLWAAAWRSLKERDLG